MSSFVETPSASESTSTSDLPGTIEVSISDTPARSGESFGLTDLRTLVAGLRASPGVAAVTDVVEWHGWAMLVSLRPDPAIDEYLQVRRELSQRRAPDRRDGEYVGFDYLSHLMDKLMYGLPRTGGRQLYGGVHVTTMPAARPIDLDELLAGT